MDAPLEGGSWSKIRQKSYKRGRLPPQFTRQNNRGELPT